jgi:hypothetical protein
MKKGKLFNPLLWAGVVLILALPLRSSATRSMQTEQAATPKNLEPAVRQMGDGLPGARLRLDTGRAVPGPAVGPHPAAGLGIDQAYGKLPLTFEANRCQTDSQVKFLTRGSGSTLFLTSTEAVLVLTRREARASRDKSPLLKRDVTQPGRVIETVVRMKLVGANPAPRVAGLEELPGKANYFITNDPAKWRTNVPTYAKVEYKHLYPGIDLVYHGNQQQLEYDFVVGPGADPKQIVLGFQGADKLEVDAQGDLLLYTAAGAIRQRKPVIYQEVDGARRDIAGGYVLKGVHRVGVQVAAYDVRRPLVIDPVVVYATYLAGSMTNPTFGQAIAIDTSGNAYVTGFTTSINFPTTSGAIQTTFPGGQDDAFVTKLNPAGSGLVYSTYLGGSDGGTSNGTGIVVDSAGYAYVTGDTTSQNFPTTPGAFQATFFGTVFAAKLNPAGSALVYSTYLGGGLDGASGIAVDAAGNAYVTGSTGSSNFPTTAGAFQPSYGGTGDAFVMKLNSTGSTPVYSTYLGGSANDTATAIAVDAAGNAYVTGNTNSADFPTTAGAFQTTAAPCVVPPQFCGNTFVTKVNPTGSGLVYSTYLHGSASGNSPGFSNSAGIAVDAAGNAYVSGETAFSDFPTTAGAFQTLLAGRRDAFVTRLNSTGAGLVYSTYLGGTNDDRGLAIAVDAAGNAYVTGSTSSADFPTTPGALQLGSPTGSGTFVTRLNPTGSGLIYSSFLDGCSNCANDIGLGIAVDASANPNAYVTGWTDASNFPTTTGAFETNFAGSTNAFVVKIAANTPPGNNVSITAGNGVTVTFANVSSSGDTTATTSNTGPAPPAGFSLGASSYYAITATATFVPPVTICIRYSPAQFNDPSTLRLFHFENSAWVDVTTSNDPVAGIICGQTSSLSPFLLVERTPLPVTIEIKPGSAPPPPINLGSNGNVPVAILSTPTFDARTVDPTTVTLASAPVKLTGKGTPSASFQDVNGDGLLDLVVNVVTDALQLSSTDPTAVLKGKTFSGQPIKGSEPVRIVPQ